MRPTVKLGEIGTFIRGVSYKKGDLLPKRENGCISLLRSNNIQAELDLSELQYLNKNSVKNEQITQKGDILFCMSNGSPHLVGKNVLLPELENYSFGAFCSIFRKTNESVLSEYIAKYLQSGNYTSFITSLSRGAGINNLRGSDLENIEIPLPPLETQKAIVAKLDQIFAELDQTKSEIHKNLDNADELWKSSLNQAFQGDWEVKKLGEVCDVRDGTHESPKYYDEGIPFITSKNLKENGIDFDNVNYISREDHINFSERSKVEVGDILFAMIGTIGNPTIVDDAREFSIKNVALIKFGGTENILNTYIRYLLDSDFTIQNLTANSRGGTQKFIALKDIRNFMIPVPPLSEQEKIVEHLDQVSKEVKALKSQYQSQLDNLEELKKSVLDKAFRGELGE